MPQAIDKQSIKPRSRANWCGIVDWWALWGLQREVKAIDGAGYRLRMLARAETALRAGRIVGGDFRMLVRLSKTVGRIFIHQD